MKTYIYTCIYCLFLSLSFSGFANANSNLKTGFSKEGSELYKLCMYNSKVTQNEMKAIFCLKNLSQRGHVPKGLGLTFYLGLLHHSEKNYQRALYWITRAAMQNYAPAQNHLGLLYYYGDPHYDTIAKQNTDTALSWFTQAAKQGNELALAYIEYIREYNTRPLDAAKLDLIIKKHKSLNKKKY